MIVFIFSLTNRPIIKTTVSSYTRHIPGGDPRNLLRKRWLGLNANGTYGDT